jgi:hypothetical protein
MDGSRLFNMNMPEGFSNCTVLEYSCEDDAGQLACLGMALAHAVNACSALETVVIKLEQHVYR